MIGNAMTRVFAMLVGSALVLAVSGCAFSGPGTHVGGNGFTDEVTPGEGSEKPVPEPDPVPH